MSITRQFEIYPTPPELAEEFCKMGSEEMAEFFIQVARSMAGYGSSHHQTMQLHYLSCDLAAGGDASADAVRWIEELARYTADAADSKKFSPLGCRSPQ